MQRGTLMERDADLELPVNDNGMPQAAGETSWRWDTELEPPVTDNAIRTALTWLEERL